MELLQKQKVVEKVRSKMFRSFEDGLRGITGKAPLAGPEMGSSSPLVSGSPSRAAKTRGFVRRFDHLHRYDLAEVKGALAESSRLG
jgi:hypothetical protein